MHIFLNVTVSSGVTELRLQTTGGTGDCDLFVKLGSQPDYFDFAAYHQQSRHHKTPGGPEELIRVTNPLPGTYYILVDGYSAFEGAHLLVTQVGPPTILAPLQNLTVCRFSLPQSDALKKVIASRLAPERCPEICLTDLEQAAWTCHCPVTDVGGDCCYIDEPAAEAFMEANRRRMLIGTGILFLVFVIVLLLSAHRK